MTNSSRDEIIVNLTTNDENKILVLSNFVGNQRDPYCCQVHLKSGSFGFIGIFYFDNFSVFVTSVERMTEEMAGSAELREDYKDQHITLELTELGHVVVSGVMERFDNISQKLIFGFKTDQTCLASFSRDLRNVLNSNSYS